MAPMLCVNEDDTNHLPNQVLNGPIPLEFSYRQPPRQSFIHEAEEQDDARSPRPWQDLYEHYPNQVNVSKYEDRSKEEAEKFLTALENRNNFMDAAANGDIAGLKKGLELGVKVDRATARGLTALVIAITEMRVDAVKFLLENGADVNHRVNNLPPLTHAASRTERGPELLRLLIDHGANLTTISRPDCRNVLHCAAAVGSAETIEFLVKEGGMDLEKKCERGCTPLLIAARSGNIKNAEVLLKLGAKPDIVSEDGQTALIYSIFTKDVDAVKFWLQQPNVNVDAQDCHGINALFIACKYGTPEIANVLLSSGADPNFRCKPDSSSPFQVAISTNNVELIKAFVTHGADLGQKNKFGEDALDIAFFERQSKAIQTLLEIQGGDDHPKESIALEIAMAQTYDVVRAIISTAQIMYPQMANNQGVTLNDFGWMEWVLNKAGSLIRPRAAYRMMHFALKEHNVAMVRALATQGCDINGLLKNGHTPLSFAIHYPNPELIKALLDLGADPTKSRAGRDSCTPLDDAIHNISRGGDTTIVDILLGSDRCLINCGKDPMRTAFSHVLMKAATWPQDNWSALAVKMVESVKDVNNDKCAIGCGLLHVATLRGNAEMIDLLLSKGADIEAVDKLGITPLILACQHSPKLIPILIERGANINALYIYESDVLIGAASYGNVESLKILVETHKRDIDVKTGRGHTPLACALTWGEEKAALYLIDKGADVHWKTQEKKQTALHLATTEGLMRVVEELLKQNVDVNAKDIDGWTPLHQACALGDVVLARILLNAGADIEAALSNGDRPLHVALINEQQDCAIFLINQGADITARASRDRTPLHICSHYSLCLAARVLLDRGVSTEDIDEETWTPLCFSVSTYIADILIAYGANVNYKDKDNFSPLHQAIAKRCYGLVEVLLMNGAEIDVRTTDDGLTIMERAMDIPNREVARRFVRLLESYRKRTLILKEIEEGHAEKRFVEEEENKGEDLDKIGEEEENKGKDLEKIGEEEESKGMSLDKNGEEEENKGKSLDKIGEKEESGDEGDDVGGRSVVV